VGDKIKCEFCSWEIKRVYRLKTGCFANSARALYNHIKEKHPEEYQKIQDWIGEENDKT
jgi:hypothetical protein